MPGDERWASGEGEVSVRRSGPGVMLITLRGQVSLNALGFVRAAVKRALVAGDRVNVFSDTEEVTGLDAGCRGEIGKMVAALRERRGGLTVLVRSKLAAAGLRVASLALGNGVAVHSDRRAFQGALNAEVARVSSPVSGAA